MQATAISEKRAYRRLDTRGSLIFKGKDGRKPLFKGSMDNFSFGGFHVRVPRRLEMNEDVEFVMMTKFLETPLAGSGKIKHVKKAKSLCRPSFSTGVEFKDTDLCNVKKFIKNNLKTKDRVQLRKGRLLRDFSWYIKCFPVLILILWVAVKTTDIFSIRMEEERKFSRALQNAALHYLYNAD